MRGARAARAAQVLLLALTLLAAPAAASPAIKLNVKFSPEHLGAGTTMIFGFKIATPKHEVPPPIVGMDLLYPAHIGLVTSELGLKNCTATILENIGPEGCPADSLMGYGTALVEIPFGHETLQETGQITTWMGPLNNGKLQLLFDAEGQTPVYAQLVFPGLVAHADPPYGGRLNTIIPVIESLPEAAHPAVTQMRATIGPMHITYYLHSRGHIIAYHPNGLLLPSRCPHRGFQFAATFAFLDGTHAIAHQTVPCPNSASHGSGR
ncbi:MAG: hypothetical protein ACYDHN_03600 [Solirubrobacteraceae bacterium]